MYGFPIDEALARRLLASPATSPAQLRNALRWLRPAGPGPGSAPGAAGGGRGELEACVREYVAALRGAGCG